MKYLKKFETESNVDMWQMSEECVKPNVVLVGDTCTISYNVTPLRGVMIQHIDGSFYTKEEWAANGFANDQANGVAVFGTNAKFVIAKTRLGSMKWSDETGVVEGATVATSEADAKVDYAGETNTALIAVGDTSGAAHACANFIFPNGRNGYLPAMGEWMTAYEHKSKINEAMAQIGGHYLQFSDGNNGYYWSSTQKSESSAWCFDSYQSTLTTKSKASSSFKIAGAPYYIHARPFMAI